MTTREYDELIEAIARGDIPPTPDQIRHREIKELLEDIRDRMPEPSGPTVGIEDENHAAYCEEIAKMLARAEKAEGVRAILEDRIEFWQEKTRLAKDTAQAYIDRAKKAEYEVAHLRKRLYALRADIRQDRATFTPSTATAILVRDDARAAEWIDNG